MTFKAPDSLAEQIAHYLAERIIRGELKERERIQEQKVTQALNVSRGSVREALLILERRHLIVGRRARHRRIGGGVEPSKHPVKIEQLAVLEAIEPVLPGEEGAKIRLAEVAMIDLLVHDDGVDVSKSVLPC